MKHYLYTYILIMAICLLSSCSQDDFCQADGFAVNNDAGVCGVLEQPNVCGEGNSRSSLVIDLTAGKMMFTWDTDDEIGVFPVTADASKSSQQEFVLYSGAGGLNGHFKKSDDGVTTLTTGKEYISYVPYTSTFDGSYDKIPISYMGQEQGANVKMKYYKPALNNESGKETEKKAYYDSEKAASAHLSKYDYCFSAKSTPKEDGNTQFDFYRFGAIVRFFLQSPNAITYDSLQLVNNSKEFVMTATIDADKLKATAKTKNHVISLHFNPGFNMTDNSSDYYYTTSKGYIIAYMMLAPIDLSASTTSPSFLYLIGHDSAGKKYYYRSADLQKPNLKSNDFYQWAKVMGSAQDAITFQEVSVEKWKEEVLNNGDGKGTEGW